jgi:hypothetical protein
MCMFWKYFEYIRPRVLSSMSPNLSLPAEDVWRIREVSCKIPWKKTTLNSRLCAYFDVDGIIDGVFFAS